MVARFKPTIIVFYKPLGVWAQVPDISQTAAKTPVGLPIPSSAYNKALAKLLLKRLMPLPLQVILEAGEWLLWHDPFLSVPSNWTQTLGGCGPGGIIGHVEVTSCPTPSQCNDILNAVNNTLANPRGKVFIRQTFFAPPLGQVHSVFNLSNCAQVPDGSRPTLVLPPVRLPLPEIIPPEWLQPDLAPELVPPTAPRLEPERVPFKPTNYEPLPWQDPHYGPERGPNPAQDVVPLPDYGPAPAPAPGYVPWTEWDPGPSPWSDITPLPHPGAIPWPTLPRAAPNPDPAPGRSPFPGVSGSPVPVPLPVAIPLPRPAIVPVVQTGPNVQVRVEPPGWSKLNSAPPRPKNKERKFVAAVTPGAASRIIGGVTEGLDIVDCMHDALPSHLQAPKLRRPDGRRRAPSFKRKAAAVYKAYLKQVDAAEGHIQHGVPNYVLSANDILNAIVECGKEQLKDRFYAALGQAGAKAGRRLKLSHGFGLGGAVRSEVTGGMTPLRS